MSPRPPPAGAGENTLGRRTLRGFGWMLLGNGSQNVIQLLVLVVLARFVAPEEFGVVGAALVAVNLTYVISETGMGPAIVQRPTLSRDHVRAGLTANAFMAVALWCLLWAGAPTVADAFGMPELERVLPVLALVLVVRNLTLGDYLLSRSLRFRPLALVEFVSYLLGYGVVAVVLAVRGAGAWAIVAGQLAQAGLRTLLLWTFAGHAMRPLFAWAPTRDLLAFGGGHVLAKGAHFLAVQSDNFVVGRWLGAAALGFYGRAYQLMTAPALMFGQVVDRVLFPAMASVQHDTARIRRAYLRGVGLLALFVLPATAFAAVLVRDVVVVLLGAEWLPMSAAFAILVYGMFFRASYRVSDSVARATGAVYRRAWRQFVYAGAVFAGAFVGKEAGLSGVALGVLGALALNFVLMAGLSLRLVAATWSDLARAHVPGLVLGVLTAGATLAMREAVGSAPSAIVLSVGAAGAGLVAFGTLRLAPHVRLLASTARLVRTLVGALGTSGRAPAMARRVLGPVYFTPTTQPSADATMAGASK